MWHYAERPGHGPLILYGLISRSGALWEASGSDSGGGHLDMPGRYEKLPSLWLNQKPAN